ncbi:uridine kinase-like protein 4 [Tanacetum coccineum]
MANLDQNNQNEVVLYDAKLSIRAQIAIASDIRTKLINTPRHALFRETCFGPWLDVQMMTKDPRLVHLILQTEYIPEQPKNDEILFRSSHDSDSVRGVVLPSLQDFDLGLEPLHELIPTLAESSTPWWMASRRFFDGSVDNFQPPLKKARFTSPPSLPEPHSQNATLIHPNHAERTKRWSGTSTSRHTKEERIMEKVVKMIDHRVSRIEELVEMASEPSLRLEERDRVLSRVLHIGVAGGAASGKTVVCNMIIEQLHDLRVVLVKQESFYYNLTSKELSEVHEYNFDHPGGSQCSSLSFYIAQ